jgi:hypothetical protein
LHFSYPKSAGIILALGVIYGGVKTMSQLEALLQALIDLSDTTAPKALADYAEETARPFAREIRELANAPIVLPRELPTTPPGWDPGDAVPLMVGPWWWVEVDSGPLDAAVRAIVHDNQETIWTVIFDFVWGYDAGQEPHMSHYLHPEEFTRENVLAAAEGLRRSMMAALLGRRLLRDDATGEYSVDPNTSAHINLWVGSNP